MAEITSASGIQPSTMYQYFSNKDEIVWAILSESMRESSGRAKQICDAASNALARLTALLKFLADELVNNPVDGAVHGTIRRYVRTRLASGTAYHTGIANQPRRVSCLHRIDPRWNR